MKHAILTAISTVAIMAAFPAFAETGANTGNSMENAVQQGWQDTKEATKQAVDDTKQAVSEAADSVKFTLFGPEEGASGKVITIDQRMTAKGMIDQPVLNSARERVGTVKDIILDEKGFAQMVIVSDAELISLGAKEVAFDYDMIVQRDKDGDFIMPLTKEMISKARKFSYKPEDAAKEDVRVMPAGGYSVEKLLRADVVNPSKEKLASVDNISFKGGHADNLIVGFDKIMGVGGDRAALAFADVSLVPDGSEAYDFQLTTDQAAQFEAFKQKASQ
jgi:hypothetical protein